MGEIIMIEPQAPYEYNGTIGYSKVQAQAIIGCSGLPYISKLIAKGKLKVVGEMPINSTSSVMRKLLNVASVLEYSEIFERRHPSIHMYQVKMSYSQLLKMQNAFPDLVFIDLTLSRRVRREEDK